MSKPDKKKVIVVHPGQQHSFRTAYALYMDNLLFKYITTIYYRNNSLTKLITNILRGNNQARAKNRRLEQLPDEIVYQDSEMFSLINLLISKTPLKRYSSFFNLKLIEKFNKNIADYAIKMDIDAIISYDYNSAELFEIIKKRAPHIKCILDNSAANRLYVKKIYDSEMKKTKQKQLQIENKSLYNKHSLNRIENEIKFSDYFIAPSNFVKKSLEFSGVDTNTIEIAPYGVDLKEFKPKQRKNITSNSRLVFIFVGRVTYAKGVNYLLEAFSKLEKYNIELRLIGNYSITPSLYEKYKSYKNIKFIGNILHSEMNDALAEGDVLVIPSLNEGLSLSGLEGLAVGLPIICTSNSGINDHIIDYYNGIVVSTGDSEEIRKSILWFINNKKEVNQMKRNAFETAKGLTWEIYYKRYAEIINKFLNK